LSVNGAHLSVNRALLSVKRAVNGVHNSRKLPCLCKFSFVYVNRSLLCGNTSFSRGNRSLWYLNTCHFVYHST